MSGLTVRWRPDGPDVEAPGPAFSWSAPRRVLTHRLALEEIDNDLGDRLAAELVRPGILDDFEAAFAGVVTSTAADPLDAWARFYAQTLRGLADAARPGEGAIATFGAIYRHAIGLLSGDSLLDAGSCFGFFCLCAAAARPGLRVAGSDVSPPTVALANAVVGRSETYRHKTSHARVRFAVADVRRGLPTTADTVTALHVLEHLAPDETATALRALCAAARRRVVVAVPLESTPDPTYGHRTAFSDLEALGRVAEAAPSGWTAETHEHRGGWLVLDRLGGLERR